MIATGQTANSCLIISRIVLRLFRWVAETTGDLAIRICVRIRIGRVIGRFQFRIAGTTPVSKGLIFIAETVDPILCVDLFQRIRCIKRVLRQIAVDRGLRQILIIQRRAVGELCELPHGSAYAVLVVSLRAPVYPAAYGSLGQQQLRLGIGADERRARRVGIGITVYRGITAPVRAAVILVLELGVFVTYEPRAIGAVGETARQAFLDGRIGIAILEVTTRLHRDGHIPHTVKNRQQSPHLPQISSMV